MTPHHEIEGNRTIVAQQGGREVAGHIMSMKRDACAIWRCARFAPQQHGAFIALSVHIAMRDRACPGQCNSRNVRIRAE
jgi:hypothetical protein